MDWYYVRNRERSGPVPEAELKSLYADGTVSASTLVWSEGMEAWKAFAEVFPDEPAPDVSVPPPAPPPPLGTGASGATPGGPRYLASGVPGDPEALGSVRYEVRIGECFGRAWTMFTGPKFGVLLGAGILANVIFIGATNIPLIGVVAGLFCWVVFAGLYQFYLGHIRGEEPPFEVMFSGFRSQFGQLVLMALIQAAAFVACMLPALLVLLLSALTGEDALLVAAGVVAVVGLLPWIYLYVAWAFAPILCLDEGLGAWTALEASRKAAGPRWIEVFLLVLLTTIVSLAGFLLLCFGFLFTAPYASLVFTYLYHDAFDRGREARGGGEAA